MTDDAPRPAPRPNKPKPEQRAVSDGRPIRPDGRQPSARTKPAEPPPVIAETVVVALPPEPEPVPTPWRKPPIGSRFFRQTMLPPSFVLGIGLIGFGAAYFLQPPDAVLRQPPPAVAVGLIAVGGLCVAVGVLLAASLRR